MLLGVGPADTEETARKLADKICHLRVFSDENGKMNLDLAAVGGSLLVVSQFTLYADTKSRRPGFTGAAQPEQAIPCMKPHGRLPGTRVYRGAWRIWRRYGGGVNK